MKLVELFDDSNPNTKTDAKKHLQQTGRGAFAIGREFYKGLTGKGTKSKGDLEREIKGGSTKHKKPTPDLSKKITPTTRFDNVIRSLYDQEHIEKDGLSLDNIKLEFEQSIKNAQKMNDKQQAKRSISDLLKKYKKYQYISTLTANEKEAIKALAGIDL